MQVQSTQNSFESLLEKIVERVQANIQGQDRLDDVLPNVVKDYAPSELGDLSANQRKTAYKQRFLATMVAYGLRDTSDELSNSREQNFASAVAYFNQQMPADQQLPADDAQARAIFDAAAQLQQDAAQYAQLLPDTQGNVLNAYASTLMTTLVGLGLFAFVHFNHNLIWFNTLSAPVFGGILGGIFLAVFIGIVIHRALKRAPFSALKAKLPDDNACTYDQVQQLSGHVMDRNDAQTVIEAQPLVANATLSTDEYADGQMRFEEQQEDADFAREQQTKLDLIDADLATLNAMKARYDIMINALQTKVEDDLCKQDEDNPVASSEAEQKALASPRYSSPLASVVTVFSGSPDPAVQPIAESGEQRAEFKQQFERVLHNIKLMLANSAEDDIFKKYDHVMPMPCQGGNENAALGRFVPPTEAQDHLLACVLAVALKTSLGARQSRRQLDAAVSEVIDAFNKIVATADQSYHLTDSDKSEVRGLFLQVHQATSVFDEYHALREHWEAKSFYQRNHWTIKGVLLLTSMATIAWFNKSLVALSAVPALPFFGAVGGVVALLGLYLLVKRVVETRRLARLKQGAENQDSRVLRGQYTWLKNKLTMRGAHSVETRIGEVLAEPRQVESDQKINRQLELLAQKARIEARITEIESKRAEVVRIQGLGCAEFQAERQRQLDAMEQQALQSAAAQASQGAGAGAGSGGGAGSRPPVKPMMLPVSENQGSGQFEVVLTYKNPTGFFAWIRKSAQECVNDWHVYHIGQSRAAGLNAEYRPVQGPSSNQHIVLTGNNQDAVVKIAFAIIADNQGLLAEQPIVKERMQPAAISQSQSEGVEVIPVAPTPAAVVTPPAGSPLPEQPALVSASDQAQAGILSAALG